MKRIHLKLTIEELKQRFSEDKPYSPEKIKNEYIDVICQYVEDNFPDEDFQFSFGKDSVDSEFINHHTIGNLIGSINNKIYFHIDVNMATWTAIGAILDIFVTQGLSSTLLSAFGLSGKTINLLSITNGEVCNCLLVKNKKADSIDSIISISTNKKCHYPNFGCRFMMKNNLCGLNNNNAKKILDSLLEKSIVKIENNKIKIS